MSNSFCTDFGVVRKDAADAACGECRACESDHFLDERLIAFALGTVVITRSS